MSDQGPEHVVQFEDENAAAEYEPTKSAHSTVTLQADGAAGSYTAPDSYRNLSQDCANWMANLPHELKVLPIIHLAIPGSHDSATWSINKHSDFAPDLDDILKKLRWLGIIVKWITSRWSKAQDYNINAQLLVGVRYFDLRIATKTTKDNKRDFFIVHGLYGPSVKEVLIEFVQFLDAHPKEVVIFDCQHFYDVTDTDHKALASMLYEHFGRKIVPSTYSYMKHLSMNYMNENNYQVIVIYRHRNCGDYNFFPSSAYPTPWPDTTSPDKLTDILTTNLANRNESVGYVSQFILTPQAKTVITNLFTGNLKKFSGLTLCRKKLGWVKDQSPGKRGVNVIIADFVDICEQDFCRSVINLNTKLLSETDSKQEGVPITGLPPVTN